MRKLLGLIVLFFFCISCQKNFNHIYKINGSVIGVKDGTLVFLEKQNDEGNIFPVDSTVVKDGKFIFEGSVLEPEFSTIRFQNESNLFGIVVESGDINFKINSYSDLKKNIFLLSGTKNNVSFNNFNESMLKIQVKLDNYQKIKKEEYLFAQKNDDKLKMNELRIGFNNIQAEFKNCILNFIIRNPNSFISMLHVQSMLGDMEPDFVKIRELYDKLSPEYKNTKIAKKIESKLKIINSLEIGKRAPDFSAPNEIGKQVELSRNLGKKLTIINFWASWCEPCKKENTILASLYQKYKNEGLNIVSVALERKNERDKWLKSIKENNMKWINVSNMNIWKDTISKVYNVNSIPKNFIIDKDGFIIGKDLKGDSLALRVKTLLNDF